MCKKCFNLTLKSHFLHIFITVRKPQRADTLEQQAAMVTEDIFKTIYRADKFMKHILLNENGTIWPLRHPGHKYIYRLGGVIACVYLENINFGGGSVRLRHFG